MTATMPLARVSRNARQQSVLVASQNYRRSLALYFFTIITIKASRFSMMGNWKERLVEALQSQIHTAATTTTTTTTTKTKTKTKTTTTTTTSTNSSAIMETMAECYCNTSLLLNQCGLTEEQVKEIREHSTLAGNVKQTVHRMMITPQQMSKIGAALSAVVVWEELLLFFVVGFLLPLAFRRLQNSNNGNHSITSSSSSSSNSAYDPQKPPPPLHPMDIIDGDGDYDDVDDDHDPCFMPSTPEKPASPRTTSSAAAGAGATTPHGAYFPVSIQYTIAYNIAQMAQLAFAVYVVDIIKVILQGIGFEFSQGELPHAFANILYMMWISNRISAIKRFILAKHTKSDPDNLRGQVQLVDRLVDACLYCIGLYVTVDSVQEDMGAAAKGFVALGSIGTLVVSLASQGLASQLFHGLFLASSNRIAVGEYVRFANGVSGTVIKLGWMETIIRAPDEVYITVPNKELADQRVSNLSRVQQSAVKQTLRFKYSDIDKLPAVLQTIKEEIKKACPELICDGSRPFRATLIGYHADHIAAQIDCRFRLKPLGHKAHQNRQNVLLAIAKAVKQYDVEFAVVDVAAVSTALRLFSNNKDKNG